VPFSEFLLLGAVTRATTRDASILPRPLRCEGNNGKSNAVAARPASLWPFPDETDDLN